MAVGHEETSSAPHCNRLSFLACLSDPRPLRPRVDRKRSGTARRIPKHIYVPFGPSCDGNAFIQSSFDPPFGLLIEPNHLSVHPNAPEISSRIGCKIEDLRHFFHQPEGPPVSLIHANEIHLLVLGVEEPPARLLLFMYIAEVAVTDIERPLSAEGDSKGARWIWQRPGPLALLIPIVQLFLLVDVRRLAEGIDCQRVAHPGLGTGGGTLVGRQSAFEDVQRGDNESPIILLLGADSPDSIRFRVRGDLLSPPAKLLPPDP